MYKGTRLAKPQMTAKERRDVLRAIAAVERRFGPVQARWAMRKHLTIITAKQKVARKVRILRAEIRQLEASAK